MRKCMPLTLTQQDYEPHTGELVNVIISKHYLYLIEENPQSRDLAGVFGPLHYSPSTLKLGFFDLLQFPQEKFHSLPHCQIKHYKD